MAQRRINAILNHLAGSDDLNHEINYENPAERYTLRPNLTSAETAHQLVLTDNKSGQKWNLPAPDTNTNGPVTPVQFIVLPKSKTTNSLTVLDNRTGKLYEIAIEDDTIPALKFKTMLGPNKKEGIRVYDPAYQNTAVARSKITEIDGEAGVLRYRGYPIEELAEKSNYLEVSYLLIFGELPNKVQYERWSNEIMHHTYIHIRVMELMKSFNYDAHPMGMFISSISAMSTYHPEANPALAGNDMYKVSSAARTKQIVRLLGKVPTVAACCYRHRIGRPYNYPQSNLGYCENFLYMLDHLSEENYMPNAKLARALDVLFILHADHELNCSTAAMRHIGSTLVDPYSAVAGAASALYGPLHGGANEAVLRMLEEIGKPENVTEFLEQVKQRKRRLMGFGHRIYKNYDPRARIIRQVAYEVFEICGREPLIEVAIELERIALSDEYFIKRKLYPNVDFYSGLIYKSMGFPTDFFPVLFAIPRVSGWLAHWVESITNPAAKIWRPRQVYVGEGKRSYVPMEHRSMPDPTENDGNDNGFNMEIHYDLSKRSAAATYEGKYRKPELKA
jgi:citrate synthase